MLQAGPFTAAKCPAALRGVPASTTKGVAFRDVPLVCASPEVGASLRKPARRMGGVCVYGEAVPCTAVTLT
jgi:hypothetical protein